MTQPVLRRLALGVASSAMSHLLVALQAIALVPFFASAWEPDAYGRWLALTAIASHLSIADLGGQNYMANLLAIHFGRGEDAEFGDRLAEAMSLFLFVGAALLALLVGAIAWAATAPFGLAAPLLSPAEALALLCLGTNAVILLVPGGVYATVYPSSGRFTRGAVITNIGRTMTLAGSMGLLALKVSPASLAAWMLAAAAATTAAIVVDTRRVIPACRDLRISLGRARAALRRITRGSLHFGVMTIATEVTQQGVVLILAALVSPAAVALYSTHRVLASIPNRLGTLAQGPLSPELSFLWARRQPGDLLAVSLLTTTAFMALGGVAAAALWVVAPAVYGAWTAHTLRFDATLACVLLVQGILASGWQTSTWGLMATNQHHALARWSAAKAALTIALAWTLAGRFGALGVALAVLTADVACGALVFPARAAAAYGASAASFYRRIAIGGVPLVPIVMSAVAASRLAPGSEPMARRLAAASAAVLAIGLAWPYVMPTARALHLRWRTQP